MSFQYFVLDHSLSQQCWDVSLCAHLHLPAFCFVLCEKHCLLTSPCDRRRYSQAWKLVSPFYRLVLMKLRIGYRRWSRSHLSELRGILCPFHSAGVVFAELHSVAVQTSSSSALAVGVHTVVWPVLPSSICARLRFRHVELIQVVSDCWDRSDKPQKSD